MWSKNRCGVEGVDGAVLTKGPGYDQVLLARVSDAPVSDVGAPRSLRSVAPH